jgi:hypothetical protein
MNQISYDILQHQVVSFLQLEDVMSLMLTSKNNYKLVVESKRFEFPCKHNVNPFLYDYWINKINIPMTMCAFLYFLQIPKKNKALKHVSEYKNGFVDLSTMIIYTVSCGTCKYDEEKLTLKIDINKHKTYNLLIKDRKIYSVDYPYESLTSIPSIETTKYATGEISSTEMLLKQVKILKSLR